MTSIDQPLKSTRLSAIVIYIIALTFTLIPLAEARGKEKHNQQRKASTRKSRVSRQSNAKHRNSRRNASTTRLSKRERRRLEARRRAAQRAAIARQRAFDAAIRGQVQSLISNDDVTGENPEVRRLAINALGNHAGTVVVMNPKTGQVLSIVNQQWGLREGFKPCSTIKLVTGLAGLNEGVIDQSEMTSVSYSNQVGLTQAMAYSKNDYFQQVGSQVGFDKMMSYARLLGLGEKTGINLRNEFDGQIPEFKSGYALNHMSSHGDDFKVTAVQLATLVSAIANGGQLLKPYVVARGQQSVGPRPVVRRPVPFEAETWKNILPGMIGSVSYGSGHRAYDPQATVVGKTGTCIEDGSWVGLFTSFAPLNDPQIAVVVIARGSDARNHFPAAVAGEIYRALSSKFTGTNNGQVASTVQFNGRSVDESTLDDDEAELSASDESFEGENAASPLSPGVSRKVYPAVRPRQANPQVRAVLKAIPQRSTTNTKTQDNFREGPSKASRRDIDDKQ